MRGCRSLRVTSSGRRLSRVTRWLHPALGRDTQLEIHRHKPAQQRGVGSVANAVIEFEQTWLDVACRAGSAISVANIARRVHPMCTRNTVAHNRRWARVLHATMVAAGFAKRHSHRTKIQSDCAASIPTSSPRAQQRRFELSTAVSTNAQRRHEPRQRLMKRSRL